MDFDGINIDFSDVRKGQILDAYLHDKSDENKYECITIIRQGSLALTFEFRSFEQKMTLKYYIDSQICRGFFVGEDLYIESEIKSLEELKDMNENATSLMQLTVYKVSNS